MHVSARAAGALLLGILLGAPASASTKAGFHRRVHLPAAASLDMYSRRARRRAALILQLELLEIRKARLERVRSVLRRRLPIDALLAPDPT